MNPPLEVSGSGQTCTIRALNERGSIILPAVIPVMEKLLAEGILEGFEVGENVVDVTVVPPSEVGTFNEEERSRQVSLLVMNLSFPLFLLSSLSLEKVRCYCSLSW